MAELQESLSVLWIGDPEKDRLEQQMLFQSVQAAGTLLGQKCDMLGVRPLTPEESEVSQFERGAAQAQSDLLLCVGRHVLLTKPCVEHLIETIVLEKSGGGRPRFVSRPVFEGREAANVSDV